MFPRPEHMQVDAYRRLAWQWQERKADLRAVLRAVGGETDLERDEVRPSVRDTRPAPPARVTDCLACARARARDRDPQRLRIEARMRVLAAERAWKSRGLPLTAFSMPAWRELRRRERLAKRRCVTH